MCKCVDVSKRCYQRIEIRSDRKTGLHDLDFQSDNDNADPDVRKFSANREELTYDNLTKKIREIYNDTIEECFSVQYLDQEGDKVTFRSTEELNNALNDQVRQTFHIQGISLQSEQSSN